MELFRKKQNNFYGFINRTHTNTWPHANANAKTTHSERWQIKGKITQRSNRQPENVHIQCSLGSWCERASDRVSERGRVRERVNSKHFKLKCEKFRLAVHELWHCYGCAVADCWNWQFNICAHTHRPLSSPSICILQNLSARRKKKQRIFRFRQSHRIINGKVKSVDFASGTRARAAFRLSTSNK